MAHAHTNLRWREISSIRSQVRSMADAEAVEQSDLTRVSISLKHSLKKVFFPDLSLPRDPTGWERLMKPSVVSN